MAAYRRRSIPELLMSVHDSPLTDAHKRRLALLALRSLSAAPEYAWQLARQSGGDAPPRASIFSERLSAGG